MSLNELLAQYFRCTALPASFVCSANGDSRCGFFHFGPDAVCYGRLDRQAVAARADQCRADAMEIASASRLAVRLPFDPAEVIDNLRLERYKGKAEVPPVLRRAYYRIRPLLPVAIRRDLQRRGLSGWKRLRFPQWPVDFTVERIHRRLLALAMRAAGVTEVPFVWFWPDGRRACVMVTHDVESSKGRDYCPRLMDVDDAFGFKSSFQFIPEGRYRVTADLLDQVRGRGFEINVHDLNHDGRLFAEHGEFRRRAARINAHAREFGARGFRSGVMYRNPDWYGELAIGYDMSIPNVAHLDPQRGGCCTVMPYFIGGLLELPLTTAQDYTLFHILGDYSIDLWRRQIDIIAGQHGLVSLNTHPDYLIPPRAASVYQRLLEHLVRLRGERRLWFALPGEVDGWWRRRSRMRVAGGPDAWRVEGPGSERARVAFARLEGDTVSYDWAGGGSRSEPASGR